MITSSPHSGLGTFSHEIIAMDMEEEEKVLVTLGRKAFNVSRMVSSDYLINESACYLDFLLLL